jgi:hypothetical protein
MSKSIGILMIVVALAIVRGPGICLEWGYGYRDRYRPYGYYRYRSPSV